MKISSKAILNPGPSGVRTPVNPLATSLSRRLRHSGSVRGGASPAMFTTTAKKRGSFDNPEPSSPKVTCIGQVRIRSKKKHKKVRTLSRRRSFRGVDHHVNGFPSKRHKHKESSNLGANQDCSSVQRKWVHFPVTICDSLRAFGSEFSCLFPCRREEKTVVGDGGGGGRVVELVVGDEELEEHEQEEEEEVILKSRRHVFEDLEIVNDRIEGHDEDEARVSICVPPKNALLLMRCRSDPMKVEALTGRSWEPNVGKTDEEDEVVDIEDRIEEGLKKPVTNLEVEQKQVLILDEDQEIVQQDEANQDQEHDIVQEDELVDIEDQIEEDLGKPMGNLEVEQKQVMILDQNQENVQQDEANQDQDQEHDIVQEDELVDIKHQIEEDLGKPMGNLEVEQKQVIILDQNQENVQQDEANQDQEHDIVQEDEANQYIKHDNMPQDEANQHQEHDNLQQDEANQHQEHNLYNQLEEESFYLVSLFEEPINQDHKIQEQDSAHEEEDDTQIAAEDSKSTTEFPEISETHEEQMLNASEEHNNGASKSESEKVLPECLLMMMYEPKLSMEVSKETWVCGEDFIQRHRNRRKPPPPPPPPPPPAIKPDGSDESTATVNDMLSVADGGLPAALRQPPRSSCSLTAELMAVALEQKLVSAVAYEPFVLTRCKSEPMRTAAAKLQPESCVLENRKLERLSRVALSVGAAGLGF